MKITDEPCCENILDDYTELFKERINYVYNYLKRNEEYNIRDFFSRLKDNSSLQLKKGYIYRFSLRVKSDIERKIRFYIGESKDYKILIHRKIKEINILDDKNRDENGRLSAIHSTEYIDEYKSIDKRYNDELKPITDMYSPLLRNYFHNIQIYTDKDDKVLSYMEYYKKMIDRRNKIEKIRNNI